MYQQVSQGVPGSPKRPAYQTRNGNDGFVSRLKVTGRCEVYQLVAGAQGSTPMHARDSTSQDDGAPNSLPPRVGPCRAKDEKEGEGDSAGSGGNNGGTSDVANGVLTFVIADGGVSQVMHAANGTS